MKILVFGMTENPGGIESVIMNYYRKIDRQKIQFDFLCNCKTIAYQEEIAALGGQVFSITPRKESFSAFRRELKSFMDTHAKDYDALWMNVCTLVNIDYLVAAKKAGIPRIIIHCHNPADTFGAVKQFMHNYNRRRLPRYATDFWSCSTESSPFFFDEGIRNGGHYRVIPNAIDTARFAFDAQVREEMRRKYALEDKLVLGHVGRFEEQKNHRQFIPIMESLVKENPAVRLLLVGQGSLEEEIRALAQSKGLLEYIVFCGVESRMEAVYQAMDVFVMPSLFEGLPVSVLEAQANGLPCVLSDTIPVAVKHNENVRFIPLDAEPHIWAQAVLSACESGRVATEKNAMFGSSYDMQCQITSFEEGLLTEVIA